MDSFPSTKNALFDPLVEKNRDFCSGFAQESNYPRAKWTIPSLVAEYTISVLHTIFFYLGVKNGFLSLDKNALIDPLL